MKPAFLKNFMAGATKYSNKRVEVDGILFDSKREAKVYGELKLLKQAGDIFNFERQVTFELIPAQYGIVNGKKKCLELSCKYIADFVVYHNDGEKTVIDAKGFRDAKYPIKRKLMLYVHKLRIKEV